MRLTPAAPAVEQCAHTLVPGSPAFASARGQVTLPFLIVAMCAMCRRLTVPRCTGTSGGSSGRHAVEGRSLQNHHQRPSHPGTVGRYLEREWGRGGGK